MEVESTTSAESAIAATRANNLRAEKDPSPIPVGSLGADDSLKLLLTQLTAQDPFRPKAGYDFMAQSSALDPGKTWQPAVASAQAGVFESRRDREILRANALIGRTVWVEHSGGGMLSGVVEAVEIEEGTPKIVVDGTSYALSGLREVEI